MAFYNRGGYISPVTAMGYGPWQGQSSFTQGQEGFSPFGGDQQGFSAFGQAQSSGTGNKRRPGSYQAFSNLWPGSRSNSNYNRSFFSPQPGVSSAGAVNQTATQAQMGGPAVDLSQGRDPAADAERLDKIRNLQDQYAQQGEMFTLESIMRQEEYLAEENQRRLDQHDRDVSYSAWVGSDNPTSIFYDPVIAAGPSYHDTLIQNLTGQYSNTYNSFQNQYGTTDQWNPYGY
jgi:hypothetical protein